MADSSTKDGGNHRDVALKRSTTTDIDAFVQAAKRYDPDRAGRLVFALDATMSRQPTWDRAMTIQATMFEAVGRAGGLAVQLVYFRGFDECRASRWVLNGTALREVMTTIRCRGGRTQIGRVLGHALHQTKQRPISALVYIGDALEEDIDELCSQAGTLGLHGVRGFFFQDGHDRIAERGFREMARLSGGVYFRLGDDSARELSALLAAVAIYAEGGLQALADSSRREAKILLEHLQ